MTWAMKSEIGGMIVFAGWVGLPLHLLEPPLRPNYRPAEFHPFLYPTGLVSAKRDNTSEIGTLANIESSIKCWMSCQKNLLC